MIRTAARLFPIRQDFARKTLGCGKKGGKMCGCLREKEFKHSPLLEKSNYLSVNQGDPGVIMVDAEKSVGAVFFVPKHRHTPQELVKLADTPLISTRQTRPRQSNTGMLCAMTIG